MPSIEAQKVLASVLSFGTSEDDFPVGGIRCQSPGYDALMLFCELLATNPPEERLQSFLSTHPGFLLGLFGTKDGGDLAFLVKPRIGTKFVSDFGLLQVFQGGATLHLIEIETSHEPVFTKQLTPARRLQAALGQISNWREWIEPNQATFIRLVLDDACAAPLYDPSRAYSGSCRFSEPDELRGLWSSFGGLECPTIAYSIILGRWSHLTADEKRRFISTYNRFDGQVFTYEQVARQAVFRSDREEF